VEMPLLMVLAEMEYQGVALDVAWLRKMGTQMGQRLDELTAEIHQLAGSPFNLDSPKQLSEVLFTRLGLPSVKLTKEGVSTDQGVLEALRWQHPIAEKMLEYRRLSKLKNTYVDKLPTMICPATGRVHASFNQTVTATGRLSSSNPNMQNIPIRSEQGQEIRRAFVAQAPEQVILAADYSQIELRLLAHFSRDPGLLEAFHSGQDIHRFVAAQVYGVPIDAVEPAQRSKAKAVNFGIIYGQTAYGLSRAIGVSQEEAQRFIDDYFARYPRIRGFMDGVIGKAKKDGGVRTILGRRRDLPDLNDRQSARRKLAERMAVNTVVQGSAADMIKVAMINIHHRIKADKLPIRMLLQVHDELVFELPEKKAAEYAAWIRKEMAAALSLDVPIVVDVGWGDNWLECK
jgi:DNA polymerase I